MPDPSYHLRCLKPLWAFHPSGQTLVACRKCSKCLNFKRNKWVYRMNRESMYWPRIWLITLTFRNLQDAHYKNTQLFLKKLRKRVNSRPLKYFAATEYGTKNGRYHMHLIVFGDRNITYRTITASWTHGFEVF